MHEAAEHKALSIDDIILVDIINGGGATCYVVVLGRYCEDLIDLIDWASLGCGNWFLVKRNISRG